jgi:hypothetical protein
MITVASSGNSLLIGQEAFRLDVLPGRPHLSHVQPSSEGDHPQYQQHRRHRFQLGYYHGFQHSLCKRGDLDRSGRGHRFSRRDAGPRFNRRSDKPRRRRGKTIGK